MTIVAGAVCFDQTWSAEERGASIAKATARYSTLAPRSLHVSQCVALYSIERPAHEPRQLTATLGDGRQRWLVGDVNYARQPIVERVQRELTTRQALPADIPGRWLCVEIAPESCRLRLHTDRLGLGWLYLARVTGGWIFSTDFAALVGHLDHAPSIDYECCVAELTLGYSLGDRTVFEGVELAPAGAVFELGKNSLEYVSRRPIEYGDALADRTDQQKFALLDELWDGTVERYFKSFPQPLISISGGYDSRHALAFFHKHGLEAEYFTFGDPESDEIAKARAHCAICGVSNQVYQFEEARWEDWGQTIQQVGNAGVVQWVGWAKAWHELLHTSGRSLVTGIFGGPWTGTHLGLSEPPRADWIAQAIDWGAGGWRHSPLLRPQARDWFDSSLRGCLEDTVGSARTAFPHQQAMHLDIYGRQRRWTAVQPALISRFLTPIPYLYSDDMLDFFTNLPFSDLRGQRLYLAYARSRFPQLFPPEKPPPSLVQRAARKLARVSKAAVTGVSAQRPPNVVDHRRMIVPNRSRIVELARDVAPVVESVFDVDGFCREVDTFGNSGDVSSYQIIRGVNLLWLLALADGRGGNSPAAHAE